MMIRRLRGARPRPRSFARSLLATSLLSCSTRPVTLPFVRPRWPLTRPLLSDMFALATFPTLSHLGARFRPWVTDHGTREISAHRQGARRSPAAGDPRAPLRGRRAHVRRGGGGDLGGAVHGVASPANPRRFRARIGASMWTACAVPGTARQPRRVPEGAATAPPPGCSRAGDGVVAPATPSRRTRATRRHVVATDSFGSHIDGRRCIDRAPEPSRPWTTAPLRPAASAVRTLRTGVKHEPHPRCRKVTTLPPHRR